MKKSILISICIYFLTSQINLYAQDNSSGIITYLKNTDMHASTKNEQVKAMIPQFSECQIILSYMDRFARTEKVEGNSEGFRTFYFGLSDNCIYDYKENIYHNFVWLPTGNFLVTGKIKESSAEIKTEIKEILGYSCRKAVIKTEDKDIEIWFTDQIPVQVSPMGDLGVSGAVLEINSISSHTTYTAASIDFKPIESSLFIISDDINKKYKRMSFEKFDEMIKNLKKAKKGKKAYTISN